MKIIEIHWISIEIHSKIQTDHVGARLTNGRGFGVILINMLRMVVGCVAASYVRCGRSSLTSPLLRFDQALGLRPSVFTSVCRLTSTTLAQV